MQQTFNSRLFAKEITKKRTKELNIGLRAAGKMIGMSHGNLGRIEKSQFIPAINNIFKICSWLGKPLSYFIITKK
jgi:transcriptional regulator with XRE-family HTH domain